MTAVMRTGRGPEGQPPGSVATDPAEVDKIIQGVMGKIYDGNVKDQTAMTNAYMEHYSEFLYDQKEATMTPTHKKGKR